MVARTGEHEERERTGRILDLVETALAADEIDALSAAIAPLLAEIASSPSAVLYVSDPRLSRTHFASCGLERDEATGLERASPAWLDRALDGESLTLSTDFGGTPLVIRSLVVDERVLGLLAILGRSVDLGDALWDRLAGIVARAVDRLAERESSERKLLHLNTYLTVSSMLAKSVDLSELLEIALYCSMEAVAAEAASILLLDETKSSFQFYRVEGSAKPLLGGATFPATEGVAGRVLETLEAEIVNDVEHDPRFYDEIDLKTGYRTRSMIAVPLVAGDERVGVLEVLNKAGGSPFTVDERLILVSVADEIAFAIRNATIFDYVVNTYCKRRQGGSSCKGCERPLGSWTPCMRYREFLP
jgi:hypothetical protein